MGDHTRCARRCARRCATWPPSRSWRQSLGESHGRGARCRGAAPVGGAHCRRRGRAYRARGDRDARRPKRRAWTTCRCASSLPRYRPCSAHQTSAAQTSPLEAGWSWHVRRGGSGRHRVRRCDRRSRIVVAPRAPLVRVVWIRARGGEQVGAKLRALKEEAHQLDALHDEYLARDERDDGGGARDGEQDAHLAEEVALSQALIRRSTPLRLPAGRPPPP